jgi:hypothetical protein
VRYRANQARVDNSVPPLDVMSEEENIDFHIERAYLEVARSFFNAVTHDNENNETRELKMPPNVMWGLVATTYAMSYAAVVAFLNSQFRRFWDDGTLKEMYPDAESLDSLLTDKHRLGSLRTALKVFCECTGRERISEANSKLWNELIQVVETNRHYVVHPKPSGTELNKFFKKAMEENTWSFAPRVASEIIGYFYDDPEAERNDWLRANQDFSFPILKLHKKQIT